jgi:glycosyltransferase involved in cell wall biosynthesis
VKLLTITAGLSSLRGRANSYQESLIENLANRGHHVSCILTALVDSKPSAHAEMRVAPWDSNARIHEIFNAGVYPALYPQGGIGTREPLGDIQPSPWLRKMVLGIIEKEQPDAISYQSIFGLPFALIEEINALGIKAVFTVHDYFAVCPTAHLFRPDHTRCRLTGQELDCNLCCKDSPSYRAFWLRENLTHLGNRMSASPFLQQSIYRLRNAVKKMSRARTPSAKGYSARRDAALRMLSSFTTLHCISDRQKSVLLNLGVDARNIALLPLIPPSITKVHPIRQPKQNQGGPIRFVALNIHGPYKGALLLSNTFKELEKAGFNYRLEIHGPEPQGFFKSTKISIQGRYSLEDLDRISALADFCLLPSIWDETLGFTAMEMLARGVPLIASNCAGASQFVQCGANGYVFNPEDQDSLVNLLKKICSPNSKDGGLAPEGKIPAGLKCYGEHIVDMEALLRN